MAVAFVQAKSYSSATSISGTAVMIFDTTPTVGNQLLVGMSYAGAKNPTSAPVGWTNEGELRVSTTAWLTIWSHKVGVAEANSYTFNTTGSDYLSVVAMEISGQATTGWLNKISLRVQTNTNSIAGTAVTPTVIGCLPVSFYAQNDGSLAAVAASVPGAGWTMDANPKPDYHGMAAGHANTLTSDTTTPINTTWRFSSGSEATDGVVGILLIAPPSATPSTTGGDKGSRFGVLNLVNVGRLG